MTSQQGTFEGTNDQKTNSQNSDMAKLLERFVKCVFCLSLLQVMGGEFEGMGFLFCMKGG